MAEEVDTAKQKLSQAAQSTKDVRLMVEGKPIKLLEE